MSDKTISTLRRVAGIVTSVAAVVCAIALVVACVGIYRSGDRPFTPESIASAWKSVAIFVWLAVTCILASGVLHLCYPPIVKKTKGTVTPQLRLTKIKTRLARKQYSPQQLAPLYKQERLIRLMRISAVVICVLCAIYPLYYLNNLENFTSIGEQLNAQVLDAVVPTLCCAAAALGYCYAVRKLSDMSCEHAILYAKAILLLPAPAAEKKPSGKQENGLPDYTIFVLRIVLLVAAVAMILVGILNGGVHDVLQKAIKICTECIGLG